jgi:hypothetical protein
MKWTLIPIGSLFMVNITSVAIIQLIFSLLDSLKGGSYGFYSNCSRSK